MDTLTVVAVTRSDAASSLLAKLSAEEHAIVVETFRHGPPRVREAGPTLALIEMGSDLDAARDACARVAEGEPSARRVALLYCTRVLAPWHLQALLYGDLAGVLDLQVTVNELVFALRAMARGTTTFLLESDTAHTQTLSATSECGGHMVDSRITADDRQLLALAAQGLSEEELSDRIYLSAHTVHHRLERLRHMLSLRNRIEMAAWAGVAGFYQAAPAHRTAAETAHLQHSRF